MHSAFLFQPNHGITCIPLQYIEIPAMYAESHDNYRIAEVIPSSDNKYLLVVLRLNPKPPAEDKQELSNEVIEKEVAEKTDKGEKPEQEEEIPEEIEEEEWKTILYLYHLNEEGLVKPDDPSVKLLSDEETPVEIVMLPKCDSSGRSFGGPDTENGIFVMTCEDGKLRILSLKTLGIVSEASVKDDRFVSATYCKSLERLCGCTVKGCLHFYSFYDLDADSSDERDDDMTTMIGNGSKTATGSDRSQYAEVDGATSSTAANLLKYDATPSTSSSPPQMPTAAVGAGQVLGENHLADILLAYKPELTLPTLKVLYSLTLFNEMLTPYSAEVPGCWSELEQAQKQRRHPQHLRPGDDTHLTKTWRLHNDATTWDEHLIELNLPKCTSLGHIDFKFSLYQPCTNPPAIQVTLLKQKSIGLCSRRKTQSINRVDESINFNIGSSDGKNFVENPVLSEEYLQARNAEILVGPIELATCMDLSEQAGSVTLTSPKLLKSKGRNYLLHIKTMTDLSKDGQAKTRGKLEIAFRHFSKFVAVKTFHPCSPPIPFTRNRTTEEANRPHNGPPVSFCVFFFFFISCPLSRFGDAHSRFDGRIPPIHKQTHTSLVPVRKKGITSILLTSFANISQQNHNTASTTNNNQNNHATAGAGGSAGKDGGSFFPDSATGLSSNKTRKNDFYIGN
ncbi:hypothetical protein RP20_CCG014350 [Aedes albopictus]|nr:hypothetical protein RP20_CCG014350 [Aedes albopictus]